MPRGGESFLPHRGSVNTASRPLLQASCWPLVATWGCVPLVFYPSGATALASNIEANLGVRGAKKEHSALLCQAQKSPGARSGVCLPMPLPPHIPEIEIAFSGGSSAESQTLRSHSRHNPGHLRSNYTGGPGARDTASFNATHGPLSLFGAKEWCCVGPRGGLFPRAEPLVLLAHCPGALAKATWLLRLR